MLTNHLRLQKPAYVCSVMVSSIQHIFSFSNTIIPPIIPKDDPVPNSLNGYLQLATLSEQLQVLLDRISAAHQIMNEP